MFDRVLITDPDDQLRNRYREFLGEDSFTVATAKNGLECAVHEESDVRITSVIVLTTGHDTELLSRVLEFPIDEFQTKPLDPFQLARKIRWVLNSKPSAGELHSRRDDGRHPPRDRPPQDEQTLTHFYQR